MKSDPDRNWVAETQPKPVFYDPRQRRRRVLLTASLLWLALLTGWFVEFFLRVDDLADLEEPASLAEIRVQAEAQSETESRVIMMKSGAATDCGQFEFFPSETPKMLSGYLPYGDETALSALRARCNDLDELYFDAFAFGGPEGTAIKPLGPRSGSFPLANFQGNWRGRNKPASFPIIRPVTWLGTTELAVELLGTSGGNFAVSLQRLPIENDLAGLCLDLSQHPLLEPAALKEVLSVLDQKASGEEFLSCLIASPDAQFLLDPEVIGRVNRALVRLPPTLFDTAAGVETLTETKTRVEALIRAIPAEKLRFAVGAQGAQLRSGQREAKRVSFAEAMHNAALHKSALGYADETGYLSIRYSDASRRFNTVWLPDTEVWLDAISSPRVNSAPVIWPLGYENPSVWDAHSSQPPDPAVAPNTLDLGNFGVFTGTGPFSTLVSSAEPGLRKEGYETSAGSNVERSFTQLPRPNHIQFFGLEPSQSALSIAFIGLPSLLRKNSLIEEFSKLGVRVTFFTSVRDLLEARETVSLVLTAGHRIGISLEPRGSQSWFATQQADLQNKLAQHLLAHQYGLRARFVLDPTSTNRVPDNQALLDQMRDLQSQNLLMVHPTVTTNVGDFEPNDVIERIYEQAFSRATNVISLNLRNASREMIEDIPTLIEKLKADGFEFYALEQLAGIDAAEALPPAKLVPLHRDNVTYEMLTTSWIGIQGVIFLLALIVALRSPLYLFLALIRRKRYPLDPSYHPPVTLIIPAYNEEKVIRRTVQSAIDCDYPNLQIIVVDDGSTDNTAGVVEAHFQDVENLRLVRQDNSGKWGAIDHAIGLAETPILTILDADSLIDPQAMSYIVQPFKDERVGAVAGTVEIGNPRNLLTAFQTLEYMYTQQIMRRAYETFDGIIVVPGAIGAWRTEAVKKAGLVSGDTITEDADLTIAVHRQNYQVRYQEAARSYTEAPVHIRDFLRQRFRWTFGMVQVSWKHKRAVTEFRPVGFVSMVDAIWYALITSLIYPIMDLILLIAVAKLAYVYATSGTIADVALPFLGSAAYIVLVCVDFLNTFFSMAFAKRFSLKLFLATPLLRFGYRQLLYISTIRALFAALFGNLARWNKLDRTGETKMPT